MCLVKALSSPLSIHCLFPPIALTEAQDINMHLKPLRHQLEDLEQAEFDESGKLMAPMMHTVCLIWSNSQYYNTPARIIVLLQEICNMIIEMVSHGDKI